MTDPIQNITKEPFDKRNLLVIILSIVLVIVVVLFFFQRSAHQSMVTEMNQEKDSIQMQLQKMVVNYDSIKTDNDDLNNTLMITQSEIKNLLVEVEQIKKASYREIKEYSNKVTTLRGIMKDLYNQIDSLNVRNKILFAENQEVKQQYTEVKTENEQLSKDKEKLEQTVKRAQMLEALELRGTGLNPRDKETDKVARTQKLLISFVLSKNLTTKRGAKNIYVRIMRPDQLLMIDSEDTRFKFEDLSIPYTAMREVNYEGMELPINIYWDNTGKDALLAGTYTVDVFTDGYNIGTTTFILSK
ncbi:MAG: coiled-coil domain-containing protein [Prolixibacteraceae bacterium]